MKYLIILAAILLSTMSHASDDNDLSTLSPYETCSFIGNVARGFIPIIREGTSAEAITDYLRKNEIRDPARRDLVDIGLYMANGLLKEFPSIQAHEVYDTTVNACVNRMIKGEEPKGKKTYL